MNAICTNILQSKKLIEIGLDIKTADMHYMYCHWEIDEHTVGDQIDARPGCSPIFYNPDRSDTDPYYIPCWSLGALMDLLPPSIQTGEGMQNHYEIDIRKYWGNEENLYQIAYGNNRGLSEEWHDMINTGEKENLIDAAFQIICWLLKNGYIKKGE